MAQVDAASPHAAAQQSLRESISMSVACLGPDAGAKTGYCWGRSQSLFIKVTGRLELDAGADGICEASRLRTRFHHAVQPWADRLPSVGC